MPKWETLDSRNKSIDREPWNLYWSESKSGTPEFEELLHDPLGVLCRDFSEVDDSWAIQSNVLNHEVGFSESIVCKVAFVDIPKKTVYLTFYKHRA